MYKCFYFFTKKRKKEKEAYNSISSVPSAIKTRAAGIWVKFDVSYLDHRDSYRIMPVIRSVRGGSS